MGVVKPAAVVAKCGEKLIQHAQITSSNTINTTNTTLIRCVGLLNRGDKGAGSARAFVETACEGNGECKNLLVSC